MGRCHPQLSLGERRKIDKWRKAKMPVPGIEDRMGRASSTIYRELKRKYWNDEDYPITSGYWYMIAQSIAKERD